MTHREELLENYEDALFAMWMHDLANLRGEALMEENERLQADPEAAVPAAVRQKNLNLIQRELQKAGRCQSARATGRRLLRLVLVAAVLLALFSAAYALSPEFRSGTLNLLMQIDEKAASFQLTPAESSEAHSDLPTVVVSWLPEGYKGNAPIADRFQTIINCTNPADNLIQVSVFWNHNTNYSIDIEDADVYEDLIIQGNPAILTIKDGLLSIFWADEALGVYVYVDSDVLTRSELIQVAEGVILSP